MFRLPSWVGFSLLALLAGGLAGFLVSTGYFSSRFRVLESTLRSRLEYVTSSEPQLKVVRVEREPAAPVIPAAFLQGRRSPLLLLVKRGTEEVSLLTPERTLGSLIALTADGWLLAPASVFEGVRLAEAGVVWGGRSYPIIKAIKDTSTALVYVQTAVQNLPVSGFVGREERLTGLPVWVETVPGRLSPHVIVDTRERFPRQISASEYMGRRYVLNGSVGSSAKGAGVWDATGQLVGIVEQGDAFGATVIPVYSVSATLPTLLQRQEIRRASLGIAGIETAAFISSGIPFTPGFVIRGERGRGVVAVDPKGPAMNFLKEGDVIERLDRDVLDGAGHLGERLWQYRPGTPLTVSGQRSGKPFQVQVTLSSVTANEVLK